MAGDGAIEMLSGNLDLVGLSPGTQVTNAGLRHLLCFPRFKKWSRRRCDLSLLQSPRISDAGVKTISQLDGLYALILPEGAHFNHCRAPDMGELIGVAFGDLEVEPKVGSGVAGGRGVDDFAQVP